MSAVSGRPLLPRERRQISQPLGWQDWPCVLTSAATVLGSGSAERCATRCAGGRWVQQISGLTGFVVRPGDSLKQALEAGEILTSGGVVEGRLDLMVPRDHSRVVGAHPLEDGFPGLRLLAESARPTVVPIRRDRTGGLVWVQ